MGSRTEDRGLETEDSELKTLRISVSDTGEGISPENIKKLFTPFERIGAEVTEIEGSGLGLSVVKNLVELMDGNVGVESKPGKGSTFWIELPQAEGQVEYNKKIGGLAKFKTVGAQKKGTLLYIEDNASNIDLVEQILKTYHPGISLLTEKYGKAAVKDASDYKPDLILLDLNLPDMHGSKVLNLLQSNPKTKAIPVVVISADAMEKQVKKLLKAGAKDYLTKPLDVLEFLRVIDEMLKPNNKHMATTRAHK